MHDIIGLKAFPKWCKIYFLNCIVLTLLDTGFKIRKKSRKKGIRRTQVLFYPSFFSFLRSGMSQSVAKITWHTPTHPPHLQPTPPHILTHQRPHPTQPTPSHTKSNGTRKSNNKMLKSKWTVLRGMV